jgi:hypothetical protein
MKPLNEVFRLIFVPTAGLSPERRDNAERNVLALR